MGAFLLKNYTYVAKDKLGKTLKGAISAENSGELMRIIHSRELFLLSYSESVSVTRGSGHKFKLKELAFICRQLSSMLTAGMSLVKSLDILYKEQASKKAKAVLLEVYEQVQKGSSLSQALNMQSGAFPEFFISMVSAGEASGSLDTVMGRLSDHYAKENRLNNKIKSATTYPIILSIMALVVVIGLFAFI
ncbi:MAG TPA: type II secretion system F family protein, partial [Oscillospiraceae bacterium]|nr:type II secretion system F family protein [Oscillospiraceae bacterium]